MPAIATQFLKIKDAEGRESVITDRANILEHRMQVSVVCDSPRHQSRHGNNDPIVWDEKEAQRDILSMPEGFFRLIKIQPDPLNESVSLVFCGPRCCKDYLDYAYVPPKTPKQILAEKEESLKVDAAAQKAIEEQNPQMKLPFPEEVNSDVD